MVSRLVVGQVQPGAVLQVKYDPQDRRRVVVLPGEEVKRPPRAAERLAELEELRQKGFVTEEEYQRKRQEILDAV